MQQKVLQRDFEENNLILRENVKANERGKLLANCEGQYESSQKLVKGTYILETLSGNLVRRTWNASKLKVNIVREQIFDTIQLP